MREAWRRRTWIVDGHNAIFAVAELCRLQQSGERQEARRALEAALRPFADRLAGRMFIVYDGNRLLPNPDAFASGRLQTLYSQPPEEADDRIVFLAQNERARRQPVTVVSNDRRSLAPRLPPGTLVMGVEDFWRACRAPEPAEEERAAPPGDYDDVARHFLERDAAIAEQARRGARQLEREAARRWRARTAPPPPEPRGVEREPSAAPPPRPPAPPVPAAPALDDGARARAREAKRQRGERRQRRRLEQVARRRGSRGRGGSRRGG
jgi:predicted RNA-binding protein with PIN domain